MVRLLVLAVLASMLCKLAIGRWPWQLLGRELRAPLVRSAAERRARALLGVSRDAHRSEIISAHKRRIAAVHPDRGGSSEQVHQANFARDLLLARLARIGSDRTE
ncbi:MAG: J domain-containing protein [Pseudomonadota bacterium]